MGILGKIRDGFYRIKDSVRLSNAIFMADQAYERTGERQYVMPSLNGKLYVMDRRNFRKMKQKGYIPQEANVNNMIRECFYCTPYSNGMGQLSDAMIKGKKKSYLSWCTAIRKLKKRRDEKEG